MPPRDSPLVAPLLLLAALDSETSGRGPPSKSSRIYSLALTYLVKGFKMETKEGVFISHITEEKTAANLLKELLRATFGPTLKIFVSSDYESIGSGEDWFNTICDALRVARVVLVLLSEVSVERRWINFEAGIGVGAQGLVIPLVFRGLAKGNIGMPLAPLHARSLSDPEDVRAMINDVGKVCGFGVRSVDSSAFVSELRNLEKGLPSHQVLLEPFLPKNPGGSSYSLQFRLSNTGSRDVELNMIEVSVPRRYMDPSWTQGADPNLIEAIIENIDGEPYQIQRFKVYDGPTNPNFGTPQRMPRFLSPGMPPQELKPPYSFALRGNLKEADGVNIPILYAVYAKNMQPEKGETTYRKLVMNTFPRALGRS